MSRPRVISYSLASLDGRLTLSPQILLLYGDPRWSEAAGEPADPYPWILNTFHPQALLEGAGSFVLPGQPGEPLPPAEGDPAPLYQDFLPAEICAVPGRRWLVITDSRGLVRWLYKEFPGEDWAGFYLLVLATRSTPSEYLAYLRRENIPYLVAGEERVDLAQALESLHERLGVDTLVSTAGGRLSGALLRAGLLDEVCVEFFPALIGGTHTPALFTAADLLSDESPTRLELTDCAVCPGGRIRLQYRVKGARA